MFFYDREKACDPYFEKNEDGGHWEKRKKDVTKYLKVDGIAPSGLKGSVVINKDEAVNDLENYQRLNDRFKLYSN